MPDFIRVNQLDYSYPLRERAQRPALQGVDFRIPAGEFTAIIGPNGSGKSTLARLLSALLLPDSGQVLVDGLDTRNTQLHARIHQQLGLVFQRPQHQIVATTVEEDVAFGPANLGLPSAEIRTRVEEALDTTGLCDYRQRPSHLLSAGETQRLALAGVLAMRPCGIIFDETTAMLDPLGRAMVMQQVRALQRQGITVLLITHLMEEAARAQRVLVLHEGKLVMDGTPAQVFSEESTLQRYGLALPPARAAVSALRGELPGLPADILTDAALLDSLPAYSGRHKTAAATAGPLQDDNPDLVRIEDLSYAYQRNTPMAHRALNGLDFCMKARQAHALIGATGCGKSTLLQHINGLLHPQSGRVQVGPFNLADENLDVKALRRMVVLAFQQPEDQIFEQYVGDEIAYAPRRLGYEGKLAEVVAQAIQSVGLDFETYKDRLTSTLSGGEKRKVALASILAIQSDLVLLDEPLAGLDPRSVEELLRTLNQQCQQGKALLISSHQYEELIPILQGVSLMQKGHTLLQGEVQSVFSRSEELNRAGLQAPLAARIADRLRQNGWPLDGPIASLDALNAALAALNAGGRHE